MSEKRFFCIINKKGRNVIIDKECNIEIIDLTMVCEVLNRLDLKLKTYNEQLGEQQGTIQLLQNEIDELKKDIDIYEYEEKKHSETVRKLYEENEKLGKELKELENNYKDLLYDGGFDE